MPRRTGTNESESTGRRSIAIVGSGVVGTATGAGLLAKGHTVTFCDVVAERVELLRSSGYAAILASELHGLHADAYLISVPSPTVDGRVDLGHVKAAAQTVGRAIRSHPGRPLVVVRSTVPPGTTERVVLPIVATASGREPGGGFGLCMSPEFLRAASAESDFQSPRVIVIGALDEQSERALRDIYSPWEKVPIVSTSLVTAEATKYVSNLFNATKISFFNEMHQVLLTIGAEPDVAFDAVTQGAEGMWNPCYGIRGGAPYGGVCLPKDTVGFLGFADDAGIGERMHVLRATIGVNERMRGLVEGEGSSEGDGFLTAAGVGGNGATSPGITVGAASALSGWWRWRRRIAPAVFAAGLLAAATLTVLKPTSGSTHPGTAATHAVAFSHSYPGDPTSVERPKVSGPPPSAPPKDTVAVHRTVTSFGKLTTLLPPGVLKRATGGAWRLSAPIAFAGRAALQVVGPATLQLLPGTYVEARDGGTVSLRSVTVVAVDAAGRPLAAPTPTRAFLLALDGGRLVLNHDRIRDLGHLAVLSYGIAMRNPGSGSVVADCLIDGNYIGVYTTHAANVAILRNTISHSVVYGVDPHTESTRIRIEGNLVTDSGTHAIILADRVSDSLIMGNLVDGAQEHGIVLFDHADGNTVVDNRVLHTFDGLVIQDSSNNRIHNDDFEPVTRFGARISGDSRGNWIAHSTFGNALLGIYVYGGARANVLWDDLFAADRENVRFRVDATGNRVAPLPARSEVGR